MSGCLDCRCDFYREDLLAAGFPLQNSCPCGHFLFLHETRADQQAKQQADQDAQRRKEVDTQLAVLGAQLTEVATQLAQLRREVLLVKTATYSTASTNDLEVIADYFDIDFAQLPPVIEKRRNDDEKVFDWCIEGIPDTEDEAKRTPAALETLETLLTQHCKDFAAHYTLENTHKKAGLFKAIDVPHRLYVTGDTDVLLRDKTTHQVLAVIEFKTTKAKAEKFKNVQLLCELVGGSLEWSQALVVLGTDLNSWWRVGYFFAPNDVKLQPYEHGNGDAAITHFLKLVQTRAERATFAPTAGQERGGFSSSSSSGTGSGSRNRRSSGTRRGRSTNSHNQAKQASTTGNGCAKKPAFPVSVCLEQDLEGCLPEEEVRAHEQLLYMMRVKRQLEEQFNEEVTIPKRFFRHLSESGTA